MYPQTKSRIQSIDILRGFAIFGVVLVNFYEINSLPAIEQNYALISITDHILFNTIKIFFYNRAYLIFSFLFGYNLFILYSNHVEKRNVIWANKVVLQRLLAIFILGVLQTTLLWWGTIIMLYAIYGLLVFLVINKTTIKIQISLILFSLFIFPIVCYIFINPNNYINITFAPNIDTNELYKAYVNGESIYLFKHNLYYWLYDFFSIQNGQVKSSALIFSISYNFQILGLIMLGYVMAGQKALQNLNFNRAIIVGSICSTIYIAIEVFVGTNGGWSLGFIKNLMFSSILVIAIVYLCQTNFIVYFKWLEIVGKTSFSFYVFHMMIAVLIFHYLGVYQMMSFSEIELFGLIVFILIFILNRALLIKYKIGCLEWILRKLTFY